MVPSTSRSLDRLPCLAVIAALFTLAAAPVPHALAASGGRDAFQYAIIARNFNTTGSVGGGNSWNAVGELQREVERTGREVFWFEIDGREYVVRDRQTVERALEIVEPMNRLGAEQGRLGSMQGELGRRQGELGAVQGRIGGLQGRVSGLQAANDPRFRTEIHELRRQLVELSVMAREMGERQRGLGEQQRALGLRQRELGEQQRRASQLAAEQLMDLAAGSIEKGIAESIGAD